MQFIKYLTFCLMLLAYNSFLCYSHKVSRPVFTPVDNVDKVVDNSAVVPEPYPTITVYPNYTDDEVEILALVIYQEAGADYCSDDTRRKVGSVFLNRVKSSLFPNTFREVAIQKQQYGTLYWTGIKWPDRAVKEQEAHAVQRAYTVARELLANGSILPDNVIYQAEFPQGDGIYCQQDDIYFCYLGGK